VIRERIADALLPDHFFIDPSLSLEWEHLPAEELPWEIFQGRLLERAHTRQQRTFEAWNIFILENGARSAEPLLAVKLDPGAGELHVTRGLLCHAWEGYHAGDNVYLSRETTRWLRELVGTITLAGLCDTGELREELSGLLFRAVVGTSRLPLTSVEAPLPAFALGQLGYFYRPEPTHAGGPMRSWRDLIAHGLHTELSKTERVKLLEVLLRAVPAEEVGEAAGQLVERWHELGYAAEELAGLLRTVLNEVSLSPWTDFAEKALAFVRRLVEGGHLTLAAQVDFLGYLLRQLGRHLAAYDLVTFHHRGANYPDALLLDLALKEYLRLIERHPELFVAEAGDLGRLRRRALRQGWLLRRRYEGHPVPDAPTSPGENARVLPPPHCRVPDEQLLQVLKRTRRLYDGDPLPVHLGEQARRVLRQSAEDLRHPDELRELGMAVFIDRPLGVFKAPAEPDQTPLLAYEAFSRAGAERRLSELARENAFALGEAEHEALRQVLGTVAVAGVPVSAVGREARPVVSVADAARVSEDFLLLRTLPGGVAEFLRLFSFHPLERRFSLDYLTAKQPVLLIRGRERAGEAALLALYDARMRKRMELAIDAREGYDMRRGVGFPAGGLRVLRVWEAQRDSGELIEVDVAEEGLVLVPAEVNPKE
jgi:hypothetical protein